MLKILYISSITPDTSCGAHIAIYRHLVYQQDFEVSVCGVSANSALTEQKFKLQRNFWLERLRRTRLSQLIFNLDYLANWYFVPKKLQTYAKNYQPDAIFTVPDNIHAGLAMKLAKKLNVPLVVDFQDLSPLSQFASNTMKPFAFVRKFLMEKFHKLHNQADLAFYTSEGMQQWFGKHSNGHVLYPIGDFERPTAIEPSNLVQPAKPITVVYAGNCYGAYGRMLLQFAKEVKNSTQIHLKIFPVGKGWTDEEIQEMREAGIYQSFMPFEQLRQEFQKADAFLTVMSFEKPEQPFVQTSFTTKWLDYVPYSKPIFVWSPEYASASIFAKKYDCGVVVNENDPSLLKNAIVDLGNSPQEWTHYCKQSRNVSDKVLNPESIHQLFVEKIKTTARVS